MNKKILLTSVLSLVLCIGLIAGSTFALFTSTSETSISVNSGKVEVDAKVENMKLYSHENINIDTLVGTRVDVNGTTYPNGGTAKYENRTVTLDRLTPGDGITFDIVVENKSNVDIRYRTIISGVSGNGLINALAVTIDGVKYAGETVSDWTVLEAEKPIEDIKVSIELPVGAGDAYQNRTASLSIAVEAVQGNAVEVVDKWDGSAVADDFAAEEDGTYLIESAADLAAFAAAVSAGDDFAGKTVTLNANIDLAGKAWTPIGYGTDSSFGEKAFAGTFDGQDYTISNISINPGSEDSESSRKWGFFVGIAADGVVKNLTLKNVSFNNVTRYFSALGSLAGRLEGKVENCHVKNVTIDSNTKMTNTGGLIGAAYNNATIDKCSVDGAIITCGITTDNGDLTAGVVGYAEGSATERVKITNTTASNITLNGQIKTKRWAGFIGYSKNTTLENCVVNNVEINVADNYQSVGGFAGDAAAGSIVENCDVNGAIIDVTNVTAGGIVGGFAASATNMNNTTVTFENCDVTGLTITVHGDITGTVAGFLGDTWSLATLDIVDCSVAGEIDTTSATVGSKGAVVVWNKWESNTVTNGTANVTIK